MCRTPETAAGFAYQGAELPKYFGCCHGCLCVVCYFLFGFFPTFGHPWPSKERYVNTRSLQWDVAGATGVNLVCLVRISSGSSIRRRINGEYFDAGDVSLLYALYVFILSLYLSCRCSNTTHKNSLWCTPYNMPRLSSHHSSTVVFVALGYITLR